MCTIISILIVGFFMSSVILGIWYFQISQRCEVIYYIKVDDTNSLLHTTSDKFLSFGLDSSLLRSMANFPLSNNKFVNLAKYLSPAYVRVGGTSADCLYFNKSIIVDFERVMHPVKDNDISNFTIYGKDLLSVLKFTKKAQLKMIFDLNVLIRNSDNSWNDTNARELILFVKGHNFISDWQLGNEPNSFFHVFKRSISAQQLARDYQHLRSILDDSGFKNSLIFGPEANHIDDHGGNKGLLYIKEFLVNARSSIDYLTWHQYYLNGRVAQVNDFVNSTIFNYLPNQINSLFKILNGTNKKPPMCLSETSTAYGGGAPELSDRFVAGFLWLDKLGYSAKSGIPIVIRQSLFGGHYAMIGQDIKPNPDWWISVAFKKFVSKKVLRLNGADYFGNVRLYAHCTSKESRINGITAVTIYGINLNREGYSKVDLHMMQHMLDKTAKIFFYAYTSDSLRSRKIKLNGDILMLLHNGTLPTFRPVVLDADQEIILPPFSMFFIIVHGLNIHVCQDENV